MTLNFDIRLKPELMARHTGDTVVYAYLGVDAGGVAHVTREARAGEARIALVQRGGRWQVPASACFFQEGGRQTF